VPRVALVPGFTQTAASWRDVARIVEESCEVAALEIPMRETFTATANALGLRAKRAIYVGYSMGGRLCLRLALDRPELVRGLVLVSTSPGLNDSEARAERAERDEELARSILRDGVDAFLQQWLAQPMFATIPAGAPGLVERRGLAPNFLVHCLRTLGVGSMDPMWHRLGELAMPVAIVTGTHDAKYDALARLMLERLHGDVTHVRLEGGHSLPLEQGAVLGGFVAAFASQHG
jgi:2-succinyl-6-hydroxy-2,4-cyclohexadiene-1-carboxylate synthase